MTGHGGAVNAVAAGALPDGTPVIISGGEDGTVRVWRTADGTPVGEPISGHGGAVNAVAAGALPDGTPVIISGGEDGTVRVWRTAGGTPVIISGGEDGAVRVWRTAGGTPVRGHDGPGERGGGRGAAGRHPGHHQRRPPTARCGYGGPPTAPRSCLRWTYPNRYELSPFTATSSSLRPGPTSPSTSQRSRGPCASYCSIGCTTTGRRNDRIMAGYPVHRRAGASTAMLMARNGYHVTRTPGVGSDGFMNVRR